MKKLQEAIIYKFSPKTNQIGKSPAVIGVGRVELPTVVGAKKREYV